MYESGTVLYTEGFDARDGTDTVLRDAGYDVTTVRTTAEARAAAAAVPFDCVVSTYEVPRDGGLEFRGGLHVLEAVRDEQPDVPFVLFTDVENRDVARDAFDAGATQYVPANLGEESFTRLLTQVEGVAARRQSQRRVDELSRVNELIRDVNSHLVRADDADDVAAAVCTRLAESESYDVAWFGRRDGDGLDRLAAAGDDAETLDSTRLAEAVVDALGEETAVRVDLTDGVACDDAGVRTHGLASGMAVVVAHDDREYGTLTLFSSRDQAFDDAEQAVVGELGDTIGHALNAAATRESLEARERQLAEQNQRLEQFASVVSHDLRNPLQVARGHVELMDETDHVAAVERALDRMGALIDDVLELARKDSLAVERERVSVAETARRAWSQVDTRAATFELGDPGAVEADPSYLQQLFENLFRNSVEHGGDDVTVRVGALADDDGFYVEDDGSGIPDDVAESLFDVGTTTASDGTGFGLAIVGRVAEAHGWSVDATTAEHPGSDGGGESGARDGAPDATARLDEDERRKERDSGGARFEIRIGDPE